MAAYFFHLFSSSVSSSSFGILLIKGYQLVVVLDFQFVQFLNQFLVVPDAVYWFILEVFLEELCTQ
jgi:hypothetical protein